MSTPPLNRGDVPVTATIADAGTVSGVVDFSKCAFGGFALPAAFDGVAISFQVSNLSSGTFQVLTAADGSPVAYVVAASKSYALPTELAGWPWFKFVASVQTGATTIIVTRKR